MNNQELGKYISDCLNSGLNTDSENSSLTNAFKIRVNQEKGYFDFGGSTIVQLFEKERIKIDSDILEKSNENIETKVEIGMKIGEKI